MKQYSLSLLILAGLIFPILLALPLCSASLGTFKQYDCVAIRVLANCSSVKLIEVTSPLSTFFINTTMTNLGGQTFNYTFCNTSALGSYSYSWNNPCVDCSQEGDCGNSFEITPSGFSGTVGFYFLVIIIVAAIIAVGLFREDPWLTILGSFGLMFFGFLIIRSGIDIIKDTMLTWAIGLIVWGVAIYLMFRGAQGAIKEGFGN